MDFISLAENPVERSLISIDKKMRVAFITTGLGRGGAEQVLLDLTCGLDREYFELCVIALGPEGPLGQVLRKQGIPFVFLGLSGRFPTPLAVGRLWRTLRDFRPHLIQTWMYHADLLGGLVGRIATDVPVLWGLHNSTLHPVATSLKTRALVRLLAVLSHTIPNKVISCSEVAAAIHQDRGYPKRLFEVIPNGVDCEKFKPDEGARRSLRCELGLTPQEFVVGHFARFHPQKDYPNFLAAARRLTGTRFLMCGDGVVAENQELSAMIHAGGDMTPFLLMGPRDDVPRWMSAVDVVVVSSLFGEAFPRVLLEAMAVGVPCVSTDVGDSQLILGETGLVVPPGDPVVLAEAIERMRQLGAEGRREWGDRARRRVLEKFTLSGMVQRYSECYRHLNERGRR